MIAGSVLPIQRAEELLATLPGVISARIVASTNGVVEEIHVLTTSEVSPKQTVRNIESALIAHLGMRVSHKKISVATSSETAKPLAPVANGDVVTGLRVESNATPIPARGAEAQGASTPAVAPAPSPSPAPTAAAPAVPPAMTRSPAAAGSPDAGAASDRAVSSPAPVVADRAPASPRAERPVESGSDAARARESSSDNAKRRLYFEDVEVRRSRSRGVACRVTLRKGDESFVGEAEGLENERLRIELAARATLSAIHQAEGDARVLALEGCKSIEAFDRQFVFVGVTTRLGRDSALLTGSAEIKESAETSSVLAILDATNRWIEYTKGLSG